MFGMFWQNHFFAAQLEEQSADPAGAGEASKRQSFFCLCSVVDVSSFLLYGGEWGRVSALELLQYKVEGIG
jgi:hypothetical protein